MQKTLVIIKPDAMARGIQDKILERFLNSGLKALSSKAIQITPELAKRHYAEHAGKPFFEGLVKFICSKAVEVMILEGENAIEKVREISGATDPNLAEAGTIRGDLKAEPIRNQDGIIQNMVHASDSQKSARREIDLFFGM